MLRRFTVSTKGNNDIIDITDKVAEAVKESKLKEGACLVFSPHSTVGITVMEYESGLISDVKEFLDRLIPKSGYKHNKTWSEENGHSHIRSLLIKPLLTVPVENGKLLLGDWQQIVLIDFDVRARERKIIIKLI